MLHHLDSEQLHLVSPASASTTTSLAATLTPGTPTQLDEQKHALSLSAINNLHLSNPPLSSSSSIIAPGPPSTAASESSDSSLFSAIDDEYEYEEDEYEYEGDYGSATRHQRAKEAARILLAQCLLEDNPRYYSEDSFSRGSRLGLAPITLLLNPETPCPTKIIPLPITDSKDSSISNSYGSSSGSSSSLDDFDDEAEAQEIQEAQQASLFIRLL